MLTSDKSRSARIPSLLPPIGEINTPLDHVAVLWPGFSSGTPFGQKAVWPVESRKHAGRLIDEPITVRTFFNDEERESDMLAVKNYLRSLENQSDKYVSVNTFSWKRSHDKLKCLTAFAVDLDLAKVTKYGRDFMAMRDDALEALSELGISQPNFTVQTGRGVHLYWLFSRLVPAKAYPRWRAAVGRLLDVLTSFGADPAVRDTARVLRLVGTTNSKCRYQDDSGQHHLWKAKADVMVTTRYCFDSLCNQILPVTRPQLEINRRARLAKAAGIKHTGPGPHLTEPPKAKPALRTRRYSDTAAARQADLDLLASTLFPSGITEGRRDAYLFNTTCNLAWLCPPEQLQATMLEWKNQHIPSMSDNEAIGTMGTAIRKAFAANAQLQAGMKLSVFDDDRYVYSAARMWNEFGLDVEAAGLTKQMTAIISTGERQERTNAKKRAKRTDHYTGAGIRQSNIPKALEAHALRAEGQSINSIAKALKKPAKTIASWLGIEIAKLQQKPATPLPEPPPLQSYPQKLESNTVLPKWNVNNGVAKNLRVFQKRAARGVRGDFPPLPPKQAPFTKKLDFNKDLDPKDADASSGAGIQDRISTGLADLLTRVLPKGPSSANEIKETKMDSPLLSSNSLVINKKEDRGSRFSNELLQWLRELSVPKTLDMLELPYKVDITFVARQSKQTGRLHVTTPSGQTIEIIHTHHQWIDVLNEKAGGGAIDLAVYLMGLKFYDAVKRLLQSDLVPIGLKPSKKI